jgi:hypothetical protein
MSQEHAECGEIGVGEIGQDSDVDGIVQKCLLVSLQPKAMQKARDVHASLPSRTRRLLSVRHGASRVQRAKAEHARAIGSASAA